MYTKQCLAGALALLIWKAVTKEIRTTGTAENPFDEPAELRTCQGWVRARRQQLHGLIGLIGLMAAYASYIGHIDLMAP